MGWDNAWTSQYLAYNPNGQETAKKRDRGPVEELTDSIGLTPGELPAYQASPELRQYYAKLLEILDNPNSFAMTPEEESSYLNNVRREGQTTLQSQGAEWDRWAAGRGISGGPEMETRMKLAQELVRNMTSARANLGDVNYRARTQARLSALAGLGGAAGMFETGNLQQYQQQLMDQLAQEQMVGNIIGKGVGYLFGGDVGAAIGGGTSLGPSGIPGYNPQVITNPRGIYG
jgi:hypothetical protein